MTENKIRKLQSASLVGISYLQKLNQQGDIQRLHYSRKWHDEKLLERMFFFKMEFMWSWRHYHRFSKS